MIGLRKASKLRNTDSYTFELGVIIVLARIDLQARDGLIDRQLTDAETYLAWPLCSFSPLMGEKLAQVLILLAVEVAWETQRLEIRIHELREEESTAVN